MTGTHTGSRTDGIRSTDGSSDGSVGERTRSAVGSATETAKETGSELTHAAVDKAGDVAQQVAGKADDRKSELAKTARTLQEKAAEFATSITDEQPQVGHMLEQVTARADKLISYVEETSIQDMSQDFSTQMRRRPMLFAAGMFGIGFALSRVLKPVDSTSSEPKQLTAGPSQAGSGGSY
jgi:acyl-CoA reductase-like NAD-dependent aldehyde dehydrogenase